MDDMAHEKEKAQYEEDRLYHGSDAYKMWEFTNPGMVGYAPCRHEPMWRDSMKYRRKEPPFQPEYFSGLNWQKISVGKQYMFSDDAENWHGPYCLLRAGELTIDNNWMPFKDRFGEYWYFAKTVPQPVKHPTVTIAGGWKLPRPEIEAPEKNTHYFFLRENTEIHSAIWYGDFGDSIRLQNRRVHLTESRAQAWADWWNETVIKAVNK